MLRIGLTGGIGSGKSTIAQIFETLGIPVYYADKAARRLYEEDASLKKAILATFGKETYVNGRLDRARLASIVFSDPQKLAMLNALVHPLTIADAKGWMQQQTSAYAIKEAALIFESAGVSGLDQVIGVFAPEDLRIQRVVKRDGISEEDVRKRMRSQMDEDEKMRLCDHVIYNDETRLVVPQVLAIHQTLMAFANR